MGFEPTTFGLEIQRSVQLSHRRNAPREIRTHIERSKASHDCHYTRGAIASNRVELFPPPSEGGILRPIDYEAT